MRLQGTEKFTLQPESFSFCRGLLQLIPIIPSGVYGDFRLCGNKLKLQKHWFAQVDYQLPSFGWLPTNFSKNTGLPK